MAAPAGRLAAELRAIVSAGMHRVHPRTRGGAAEGSVEVAKRGPELRESTLAWYRDHWRELSVQSSVERLEEVYAG